MFDRYTFQSDSYPKRTTITEKRAPTDESVRLLREMEAAAEKQVVERGRTNNNDLQFRWVIRNLYAEDLLQLTVFVTLNGNEHKMTTNWCPTRFGNPREKLRLIYGEVEKLIAEKITAGLIEKHLRDLVPQP